MLGVDSAGIGEGESVAVAGGATASDSGFGDRRFSYESLGENDDSTKRAIIP